MNEFSSTTRRLLLLGGSCLAVCLLNTFALQPLLDARADLLVRRDAAAAQLRTRCDLLAEDARLQKLVRQMPIATDPSVAENHLLHLASQWEQSAGLSDASFQRVRTTKVGTFTQITVETAAAGPMPAVASLLQDVEVERTPLRVESLRISSATEQDGSELRVELTLSTLCKPPVDSPGDVRVAAVGGDGSPQ